MWRKHACLVAVLFMHEASATSLGQQRPPASLVSKSRWARFELVLGRINAMSVLGGQRRCAQNRGSDDEVSETLAINTDSEIPTIRYELVDDAQTLRIEVINRTEIQIHREPRGGSSLAQVHYLQPKHGPIQLSIKQGEWSRTLQARSLWHMLLAEPEMCREHLLPILRPLNPDWRLQETTERIEAALHGATPAGNTIPRERVLKLVAKMDAPDFPTRQAAHRELRAAGVAILPYLKSIDVTQMASEQRSRIKRIRKDLQHQGPDAPERIASWLQHDETLWRSWLGHHNPQRRLAAAQRLAAIHSRSVDPGQKQDAVRRMAQAPIHP